MLSTPVQRLKALKKKEDHQFKKRSQEMLTGRKLAKGAYEYEFKAIVINIFLIENPVIQMNSNKIIYLLVQCC